MILLMLFFLWIFSRSFAYFNTGASKEDILNEEEYKAAYHTPSFTWADNGNEGREVEDYLKEILSKDYAHAWYYWNIQHKNGFAENSRIFYSMIYTDEFSKIFSAEPLSKKKVNRVDLEHHLDIHLYALDGQVISFTDSAAVIVEEIMNDEGKIIHSKKIEMTLDVVMVFQDAGWTIQHMVPRNIQDHDFPYVDAQIPQAPYYKVGAAASYQRNQQEFRPKGINYYPQAFPWDIWEPFPEDTIRDDLRIIKELGMNTIRIFVGFDEFGKGYVNYEYLEKLRILLDMAEDEDIAVIVTLFDFVGNYELPNWPACDRHLETILKKFRTHPAIFAWDIKNEPDLDFKHAQTDRVINWLEFMLAKARQYDPNHMITIGWSQPEMAYLYEERLDFVSFHYYRKSKDLAVAIQELKQQTNKPVVLGEFGMSTYNSYLFPFGKYEEEQAQYYNEILAVLEQDEIPFISWTLHDFPEVPSKVVGSLPWRKNPQAHFGILKQDGSPKLVADVLADSFDHSTSIQISWIQKVLRPFHVGVLLGIIFVIVGVLLFWKRKLIIQRLNLFSSSS